MPAPHAVMAVMHCSQVVGGRGSADVRARCPDGWQEDAVTERDVDVEGFLRGPVFEPLHEDPELFRAVRVESGTVVWPNGADIDPVVLRGFAEPAWKGDERPRAAG